MRALRRNQRPFWYCLFKGVTEMTDGNGDYTGETSSEYYPPVQLMGNIGRETGQSSLNPWESDDYRKITVADTNLPIEKGTVLFLDHAPTDGYNGYDYIVLRVSRSINSSTIIAKKVEVR